MVPINLPTLSGNGTHASPYLITSETDWNTLAFDINVLGLGHDSYYNKFFLLTNDIEVSEMIGINEEAEYSFLGIFNGGGHTITFNMGTADHPFNEEYCAPFRYTRVPYILNLHTTGTIYTQNQRAAGIVGRAYIEPFSTCGLYSCSSSMTIIGSGSGDVAHGGLVGWVYLEGVGDGDASFNLMNCRFDGTLTNAGSTINWGGFIGWISDLYGNNRKVRITNSLFAPQSVPSVSGCCTFARRKIDNNLVITNSYYTTVLGTAQGQSGSQNQQLAITLGPRWEFVDNKVLPIIRASLLTLSGQGTEASPYQITSVTDWDKFYYNVNILWHDYSGEYIQMTADVSNVNTMVGYNYNPYSGNFNIVPFSGHFDGDGKKLTVNLDTQEEYVAPFRMIENATISGLIVADAITTLNKYAGGIASNLHGSNTIRNCKVSATITASISGDGTHGGFAGVISNGTTNFDGCAFDGKLLSPTNTYNCGGFVGWTEGNNGAGFNITNSLFNPTEVTMTGDKTFARFRDNSPYSNIINCYYFQTFGAPQGKEVHSITGENVTVENAGLPVTEYNVSGITAYGTGIKYNDVVYAGNGDNVILSLGYMVNNGYYNGYTADNGTLTGTAHTGTNDAYTLAMVDENTIISPTIGSHILQICSVGDWNTFCDAINDGHSYIDDTVILTTDVTVSKMAGTSKTLSFQGTFDGQGHTITLNGGDFGTSSSAQSNADCAPFRFVSAGTFLNLEVTGHIYSSSQRAAGFIAIAGDGNLTFTNCVSSVNIHASRSNADGTHGGFIGNLQGYNNQECTATFNGCAFTGSITTDTGTTNAGGFVGWCEWRNDSSTDKGRCHLVLNNCVVAPNTTCNLSGSKTFSRFRSESNSSTINNSYYTQTIGDAQGKKAYSISGVNSVTVAMSGTPDTQYSVNGIDVYSTGIVFSNTLYAGNGERVSLSLSYTGSGTLNSYTADHGTLNGTAHTGTNDAYELVMGAYNTIISAILDPIYNIASVDD